jgi:hypothetical protein
MSTTYQEYNLTPLTNPATGRTITGKIRFLSGSIYSMNWGIAGSPAKYFPGTQTIDAVGSALSGVGDYATSTLATFSGAWTLSGGQMTIDLSAGGSFHYSQPGSGFHLQPFGSGNAQVSAWGGGWGNEPTFILSGLANPYVFATYSRDLTWPTDAVANTI